MLPVYVSVSLLQDLSLSFYVFPIGGKPQGTVLNYRCPSGNVIKMAVMESLFLVSFWDEYGVSVGVTAISDMLTSDSWNHVVVVRRFSTGNIQVRLLYPMVSHPPLMYVIG